MPNWGHLTVSRLLFALIVACGLSGAAAAQNYGIFNETSDEASETAEMGAADAVDAADAETGGDPALEEDPGGPDLAAYGQVAEVYERESALQATQQQVGVFRQKARRIFGAADRYVEKLDRTLAEASPTGSSTYFLGVLLFTAILLAIGRAVTMIYNMYIALPVMRRVQSPNPRGIVDKLPVLGVRVGLQLVGVIITLIVAATVGAGFYTEDPATLTTVVLIAATYALSQIIDVLWRMVVSPFLSEYRIPAFSDRDARRLYRWLAAGALIGVTANMFGVWLLEMEAPEEVRALTTIALTTLSMALIFLMLRSCGRSITNALLGGYRREEASWIAAVASWLWLPAVVAYLLFAYGEMVYRQIMGLEANVSLLGGAFSVLLAGIVVYAVTVYVIERIFRRARTLREVNERAEVADREEDIAADKLAIRDVLEEVGGDADGDEEGGAGPAHMREAAEAPRRRGMRTFEDLAHRVASLFALGASSYALVRLWLGADAFSDGGAFSIAEDLIDIAFLGYIAFHAARIWMDQKIAEETADLPDSAEPGDEGGAGAAASRLATILPLFRTFVLLIIAVTSVLLILMEMGINVAPLFAGAGVVGLAIGFGAQSLVRDILSGVFFLSDDAFRKGEYIDVGDVKGTVEKISLRSFQLRHHLGALNTIPFGEIKHLTNYSRDWVMMKLPLRLTYDTDVDKVRKLVKKLGVALLDHPTEGHKFVQPLKSQGVYMMEDSAMIIRVKFMTRPGDQWTTRKLVYQEIRNLFEKEGIKFAHKEVTVRIPDLDDPAREGQVSEQERKAIGAAARRVVEEEGLGAPVPADAR
ncbi:MAG: mechanosensitive ion channel family protein [Pseudomonadota bacterium]